MKTAVFYIIFSVLLKIAQSRNATIYKVRFEIREENMAGLLGFLIDTYPDKNLPVEHYVSFMDLNSINYAQYQGFETNTILNKSCLTVLESLPFSPTEKFQEFMRTFNIPTKTMSKASLALNIDWEDLLQASAFDRNDTAFYSIIRLGNFSESNIDTALQIINKTREDVFNYTKPFILDAMYSLSYEAFAATIGDLPKFVVALIGAMNMSSENIKTSPIIQHFNASLIMENLATPISNNTLITTDDVYYKSNDEDFQKYLRITLTDKDSLEAIDVKYDNTFTTITTKQSIVSYYEPTECTSALTDCTFHTLVESYPIPKVSCIGGNIVIPKLNTEFVPGSPLICDNRLYGIAVSGINNEIKLKGFKANNMQIESSNVHVLSYDFIKEKLPKLVANLMARADYSRNITTWHLISLLELDVIELDQLRNMTIEANMQHQVCGIIMDIFEKYNLNAIGVYQKFVNSLVDKQQINAAFRAVQINETEILNAVAYHSDNQTYFLSAIKKGNFTQQNIQNAVTALNKTVDEIYAFLQPLILAEFIKVNYSDIPNKKEYLTQAFRIFHVQPDAFFQNPFDVMLDAYYNKINPRKILATAVSKSNLLTASEFRSSIDTENSNYVQLYAGEFQVQNFVNYNAGYSNLTTNAMIKQFWPVTSSYQKMKNCSYVTHEGSVLVQEPHMNSDKILITKSKGMVYYPGGSLICKDIVYGVALAETQTSIEFATLKHSNAASTNQGVFICLVFNILLSFKQIFT